MGKVTVESLERIHRALRFNSIIFWVGIVFMAMAVLIGLLSKDNINNLAFIFSSIGYIALGGVRVVAIIFGGLKTLFDVEYIIKVKTTYSDGTSSVRDDTPLFYERAIFKLIGILFAVLIGPFVTCIHLIIQIIKYSLWKLISKEKSTLKPSGLVLILIDLALIAGIIGLIIYAFAFSS